MPRRGDNIHKRKDGRWEGRYKNGFKKDGSVKYSSVYAASFSECKSKLQKAQSIPMPLTTKKSDLFFTEVLYRWLESNRIRLKGATETKYQNIIETHIIPAIGGIRMSQLNSMIINSFLDEKIQGGGIKEQRPLAASYVKTMAIIIEASVKFAVTEGLCAPLKTPIHKPSVPKREILTLSEAQENTLLEVLLCERSNVAIGTLIALHTGMRIGEVCALKWCDIDFNSEIIHVRHTISRVNANCESQKTMLILDTPKTESSKRNLPMSYLLKEVLSIAYQNRKSEFVVSDNQNFVGTRTFDYQYRKMLNNNNLPIVNFHTLRHTFATRCAESGMDAKTLSLLLGHSTANVTLNVYVHPSMDIIKKQIEQLYCPA